MDADEKREVVSEANKIYDVEDVILRFILPLS